MSPPKRISREEYLSNIQGVCDEHAPKPQARWAKKDPSFFKGKWVKKGFETSPKPVNAPAHYPWPSVEHMWVKVLRTNKGKIVGTLANQPMFVLDMKFGQEVTLSVHEIEDVTNSAD